MSTTDRRLLSQNPDTGISNYFHWDPTTDGFTVESVQDVGLIVEDNKVRANMAPSGWKGEWHHVAEIPLLVLEILRKQHVLDDPKKLKAWLNDSANAAFRVKRGRV